jgi:hypothetical protein
MKRAYQPKRLERMIDNADEMLDERSLSARLGAEETDWRVLRQEDVDAGRQSPVYFSQVDEHRQSPADFVFTKGNRRLLSRSIPGALRANSGIVQFR